MDRKSLETLELPKVLDRLADHAHFSASKERARSLSPSSEGDLVALRQALTAEARALLEENPDLTIGGAHDVRPMVKEAELGGVFEPSQILLIKDTLVAARTNRRRLEERADSLPRLAQLAQGLRLPAGLIDHISRVLDEGGEVLDTASQELNALRKRMKIAHDRLTSKLKAMVSDSRVASMLQEPIVTQREGRYVLPLRAEYKGQLKSVVHDQSSSGATLFVEPLAVVDLNNEVRELELAERAEVRRILGELSEAIGSQRNQLEAIVVALADIDLALAKARYAEHLKAQPVQVGNGAPPERGGGEGRLRLFGARHPLLEMETVVPIDIVLEGRTRALVITGPNTGGKTVALKTAGLLTAMVLCGLQVPVEIGSEVPLFHNVLADIGDEQSIEQSLSTFSGHVANIIRILEQADERSLVLLDELGAGTDPLEGASLAMAILQELLERRCTALIATHYPELKSFAHVMEGVENASVQFDVESLQPTYHMRIGLPGRSNALAIAQRLGMPQEIVAGARSHLSPSDLETDDLLDEIRRQREAADRAQSEAEQRLAAVQAQQAELRRRLSTIEEERQSLLDGARDRAKAEIKAVEDEMRALRTQLALAGQPLEQVERVKREVEELERDFEESIEPLDRSAGLAPQEGDRVQVTRLGREGIVAEVGADEAEVQVGNVRVRVPWAELEPLEQEMTEERASPPKVAGVKTPTAQLPDLELDLRGMTVDEALLELEGRLDEALLAGAPRIRVIHGKGSGRLRQAVRRSLKGSDYVASFRAGRRGEGGDGVTVIELAI